MRGKKQFPTPHYLFAVRDVLRNWHYFDMTLDESEQQAFPLAFEAISANGEFSKAPRSAKTLAIKIIENIGRVLADYYKSDFVQAEKMLQHIYNECDDRELREFISLPLKNIEEIKQNRSPYKPNFAADMISNFIVAVVNRIPPTAELEVFEMTDLQWEYLNKRRSGEYEHNI